MPDNTINWGQGTVNNTNDWGGAKANSANSFGAVYENSPSGDTNIVGGTALSITYSASAYCDGIGDTPQPTVAGNTGAGTFSSTAGLTINSSTGVIDVDASTKGATYVVTYTDTDSDIATANVTLNDLDNASFSYSASSYTQADADPTPTITGLTGGTFSGTSGLVINSTTGEIDLSASTIASHTVTYSTSSSGSSVCPNTSTFSLAVTAAYSPFQMQFDTSGGKTITIPGTVGSSFTVDWGDGNTTTETGGDISHTYDSGIATSIVSIGAQGDTGAFGGLRFNNGGSKTDLLEIQQWGSIDFITLFLGFYGCSNMQITATDSPNLLLSGSGSSTSFQQIFFNCTALTGNSYMNNWDVSNVTNMFYAFANTAFNADISNWDVSNVTSFSRCFQGCSNFNQDISSWDMSSVTDASFMLYYATSFDQPIGSWDLTSATNLYQMLIGASSFNQNIGGWSLRTASTPNMGYLLFGTTSMSNANSTDSVVGWANYVYNNTAPFNVSLTNSNINAKFEGTRSGGANFATAADAKTYLTTTAGWTIN